MHTIEGRELPQERDEKIADRASNVAVARQNEGIDGLSAADLSLIVADQTPRSGLARLIALARGARSPMPMPATTSTR